MRPPFVFCATLAVATAFTCLPQATGGEPDTRVPQNQPKTRVTPFLMFEGRAEEAMNFYVSVFPDARVVTIKRYGKNSPGKEGTIEQAVFELAGQRIMCIDSPVKHRFTFTPSISFFVDCASETQINQAFAKLSAGGEVLMPLDNHGFSQKFAWVQDRFGVSWQINLP